MSSHDRHTSPEHPRNRSAQVPIVGSVNQADTDPDYQRRMARPGPDDNAAAAYQQNHANVGAGGGDEEPAGQNLVAPRIGWVVQEEPVSDQLQFLIERTELADRQKREADARALLDEGNRLELAGDHRRRWIVKATAARIFRDSGGLLDGEALFNQFRGLIDDNRTLAAKKGNDNVRVVLQRDGWADIAIEWRPALDQAIDDAEPVDDWATVEKKPARPWLVFSKTHQFGNCGAKLVTFRNGDPERFATFGEAVIAARRIGQTVSARAIEFQNQGHEVKFL